MRSPEHRRAASPKAGKNFDVDLHLRYLSPGAFTVLQPNSGPPPDPPSAPNPYRLTPSVKRNKHQSFAIIGEINGSQPGSRSSSPTTGGRVSPFRGHGFNPTGSRLASPSPSPPPEDARLTPTKLQSPSKQSKIPQYSKRGNNVFGDRVSHLQSPPTKRRFNQKLSQSLTNLQATTTVKRPPQNPKRTTRKTSFHQLSPIVGSSPEPSQSLSSPSRLPKSQSQPASRITSPSRRPPPAAARTTRVSINRQSTSSDSSPTKNPTSPTRIPVKRFKNVQSKVNSFSRPNKPQVPPKPAELSTSEQTDTDANKKPSTMNRLRKTQSKLNLTRITTNNNQNNNKNNNNNNDKKLSTNKNLSNNNNNINNNNLTKGVTVTNTIKNMKNKAKNAKPKNDKNEETADESKKTLSDLIQPSATTVVSSTTTTATKPLKIEAKIDPPVQYDPPKPVSPMVDGRVLSATSVSNAMNRMNDTVLDTQTLIRDHARFSPAAKTILSMNSAKRALPTTVESTTTTTTTTTISTNKPVMAETKNQTNHVTHAGVIDGKILESNMSKLISPDHSIGNSVHKSVNERLVEARTVVAGDVQPIRITVKEKPSEIEVQSGNVRVSANSMNGLTDRPSLPPTNRTPPNEPENTENDGQKSNACIRFFSSVKNKLTRNNNNKDVTKKTSVKSTESKPNSEDTENESEKTGCFRCGGGKKKKKSEVRINIEDEDDDGTKKSCLDRLKCCGKNKVGDNTSCFPTGKRKNSWAERRDSILSDPPPPTSKCSKDCCRKFWRKVFCLDCCKKKPVEVNVSRKPSTVSKKKSLTPTSMAPPPEDTRSKLDMSLVEHMSHMRAAIPVLPISLAWICLVFNVVAPGTGTFFSGLFCLCVGKPRFSQHDGPKPRIGAFIINCFVGFGQFFTVLFCLVGWGWSIWWGVTMVKLSKKYRKLKQLQAIEEANEAAEAAAEAANPKAKKGRDAERGS